MLPEEEPLRLACPKALTHHLHRSPREVLAELADATPAEAYFDGYGEGALLRDFESRIAGELGKEDAVFMPSGTMAQQIALRIWCDRAHTPNVAFHPLSHLELHESHAYSFLHGLRAQYTGAATRLMNAHDLESLSKPLAAVLIELPQRELGCQLPSWEDLNALCDAARGENAKLHLDGARLWESAPYYGRTHAEIASLFDSVYVSFYKGLNAIAGAALAGDKTFIDEARVWQHRHGGRLISIAPFVISAQLGFERYLPQMSTYSQRAREVANLLKGIAGVSIVPDPPQTNAFYTFINGDRDRLEARAKTYATENGTWSFGKLAPTLDPGVQRWEFVAASATCAMTLQEIEATLLFILTD